MKELLLIIAVLFVVILILPSGREHFSQLWKACQGDTSSIFDAEHNLEISVTGFNYASVPLWYAGPETARDGDELIQVKPVDVYQNNNRSCSDSSPHGGYHYIFYANDLNSKEGQYPNYLFTSDDITPSVWISGKKCGAAKVRKAFETAKGIMWHVEAQN